MIRVRVKNRSGQQTHGGDFNSSEEAHAWVVSQESIKAFGKPERWVHEDDLSVMGEDKLQAIASEDVGGPDEMKKRYKFSADYTIESEDITSEILAAVERNQALEYLNETDWYVLRKVETGVEIPDEVRNLRSEARVKLGRV